MLFFSDIFHLFTFMSNYFEILLYNISNLFLKILSIYAIL